MKLQDANIFISKSGRPRFCEENVLPVSWEESILCKTLLLLQRNLNTTLQNPLWKKKTVNISGKSNSQFYPSLLPLQRLNSCENAPLLRGLLNFYFQCLKTSELFPKGKHVLEAIACHQI